MTNPLQQAEDANAELLTQRRDRWYPQVHIAARAGWINDPNGLCHFGDRYHVFFQHNPAGVVWGPMHWGHVWSRDLVHWNRAPIALAPSLPEDQDGVFSGSAVVTDDGTLAVLYTGHRVATTAGHDMVEQCQMLATSTDGMTFTKHGVVIESRGRADFRDPKVWRQDQQWHMVVAMSSPQRRGQVWHYSSDDLMHWDEGHLLFEDPDPNVYMVECPDLFRLGDKWVLLYGPMTTARPHGHVGRNGHNCGYVVGDWNGTQFTPLTDFTPMDWGHNFYAPQTMLAPDGRRLLLGWMGSFAHPLACQEDGWCGQLTVPRELRLDDDLRLHSSPIAEFSQLGRPGKDLGPITVEPGQPLTLHRGSNPVEVCLGIDLAASRAEQIGLRIHDNGSGRRTWVGYDDLSERVFVDLSTVSETSGGYRSARLTRPNNDSRDAATRTADELCLRVIIDRGSVEVFADDGRIVLSSFSFPVDSERSVALDTVSGCATLTSVRTRPLAPHWNEPDRG